MGTEQNVAYLDGHEANERDDGQVDSVVEQWFCLQPFGSKADVALGASGLPASNSQHDTYTDLRVVSRVPTVEANGQRWNIEITYELVNEYDEVEGYQLQFLEYGTHELQQDVTINLGTGAVVVDGAGLPPTKSIQTSRSYPYIKIVKKEGSSNRADVLAYSGTINDAEITVAGVTIPAHAGKIRITAVEGPSTEDYPWEISYEVLVRYNSLANYIDFLGSLQDGPDEIGWDEGYINEGFFYYDPSDGWLRATETVKLASGDEEEQPSATPVLLDQNGAVLSAGNEPISVRLQTTPEGDWSGLGLNNL